MVNGMHIYGWPITAKLADFGWNKRRFPANKPAGEAGKTFRKSRAPEAGKEAMFKEPPRFVNRKENQSFAEIIPSEILVKTGNGLFPIRIEESSSSVSSEWLSKTLGLNPGARFKVEEEIATDEFPLASGEGEWRLVERCQCKSDRAVDRSKDQLCVRKKGEIRGIMGPNFRRPRKDLEDREARSDKATLPKEPFLNLCVEEKGKGKWIRKLKSKPPRFPACKGGIRIGVDRPSQKSSSSSAESSSSEDELAGRGFFKFGLVNALKGLGLAAHQCVEG
ncbi:hypothetical protein Q3G72_030839 [Acer saccharum]|nr:hypothetical protein Q3G72_030839 [Acer saccharum]